MKKIYLSICVVMLTTSVFAQSRMAEMLKKDATNYVANVVPTITPSVLSTAPAPFWTDDFSNAANWVIDHDPTACALDWQIGSNSCTGSYPINDIVSTSAANGWAMIDSDSYGGVTGGTEVEDCWLTMANPVDLNGYPYVTLEFETQYRSYNSEQCYIVVGIGDGSGNVTWPDLTPTTDISTMTNVFALFQGFSSGDATTNPQIVKLNIGSALVGLTPTELADIYIRFHWTGTWGYAWFVDDVSLSETPDNLITIQEEVFGGWWVGYQTAGGIGFDYSLYPMNQATANPYAFESVIANEGLATQNVIMNVEVTEDATQNSAYSGSSNAITLAIAERDTFVTTTTFSPINIGAYTIEMWGVGDSANTNTTVKTTVVTDTVYARDMGVEEGAWRVGRPCGGMVLGVEFDVYITDDLTSVSAYVTDISVPGAIMFGALYEADPQGSPIWLAQTDDYTIQQTDLGNWVTISFNGQQSLFSGTTYMIAIGGYAHPNDTFSISVSGESQAGCTIQDNGCSLGSGGFGDWYTIADVPMIRMNFGSSTSSINETAFNGTLHVYPNPTKSQITIDLNNTISDNYLFTISNILGEEVYSYQAFVNGNFQKDIDLSSLSKGVYLLNINNSNSSVTERIVIE